jgi:hypothetical protein
MESALEMAKKRLVRIEGRLEGTLGFVFHSRYHVLTTFSSVFWAESLRVRLPDGSISTARVVAKNSAADLALLELDRAALDKPMPIGPAVHVGDPVFAVGSTSYDRWGGKTIHAGVVNSSREKQFHTDALQASFYREGGPILDCRGQLVGMATSSWGQAAISIEHAVALTDEIGKQEIYEGPVVRPHFEFGVPVHFDDYAAGAGVSLGLGLVFDQSFELKLKGGLVALKQLHGEQESGARLFAQTLLGYRMFLDADRDFSVNVGAGLTFAHDRFCRDQCSDDNPPFVMRNRFLPTVETGLQFWPGFISYQFMMDTEHWELSTHQLMLGIDI